MPYLQVKNMAYVPYWLQGRCPVLVRETDDLHRQSGRPASPRRIRRGTGGRPPAPNAKHQVGGVGVAVNLDAAVAVPGCVGRGPPLAALGVHIHTGTRSRRGSSQACRTRPRFQPALDDPVDEVRHPGRVGANRRASRRCRRTRSLKVATSVSEDLGPPDGRGSRRCSGGGRCPKRISSLANSWAVLSTPAGPGDCARLWRT